MFSAQNSKRAFGKFFQKCDSMCFDCGWRLCIYIFLFLLLLLLLLLFFIEKRSISEMLFVSGSRALCMGPTTSLVAKFPLKLHYLVGPVHCLQDPQTSFFNNFFTKNGSHGSIHTFKNDFTTMFSVFSFQQNKRYPNGCVF